MGKKKYIKNSKGVTMSVTTDTLGLEKPLLNENYDIDVHNRNMDKIDEDLTPIDDSYIIELFQHDGDISRPKDYYTKEESDLKYATKEEVQGNTNLANQALNKANEAFQRGDNVKTQLVDKLISEGLDVSTNNTFEELIENIALGKKWASGSISSTTTYQSYYLRSGVYTSIFYTVTVSNLEFTPSCVVLMQETTSPNKCTSHYSEFLDSNSCITGFAIGGTGSMSSLNALINDSSKNTNLKVANNGFVLPTYLNGTFTWIAFE